MNLPHPFDNASDIKATLDGAISLVDQQGKRLARVPMTTGLELSSKSEGHGHGYSYGFSFGDGSGMISGYGDGHGFGDGYGDDVGDGDGSGKSK